MTANPSQNLPRILVVDDTVRNIQVLETILRDHFHINISTSGLQALELAGKVEPDLILLDDVLPGFELGAVDYVTKPFNPTELMRRVDSHLELKFARERMAPLAGQLSRYLSPYVYRSSKERRKQRSPHAGST